MRNISLILAAAVTFSGGAIAQTYPSSPVKLVVGFTPGGAVDAATRAFAERLSSRLGQNVLVENRPGASEILAAQFVAKSRPDGHTLLISTDAPFTSNQFMYRNLGYNPNADFTAIGILMTSPLVLATSPKFPATNYKEFLSAVRGDSRGPRIGTTGGGVQTAMGYLAHNEGFAWENVLYKGVPASMPDLIESRLDAVLGSPPVMAPFIINGRIKGLAVAGDTRLKILPDLPSFKELGIKDAGARFLVTLSGPAGLPKPIVDQLSKAVSEIVMDPSFQKRHLDDLGMTATVSSPREFAEHIEKERIVQRERIAKFGPKME